MLEVRSTPLSFENQLIQNLHESHPIQITTIRLNGDDFLCYSNQSECTLGEEKKLATSLET